MTKKVTILGKKILPIWLMVVLLLASGAGAAVGTILVGQVTGEINVSTAGSAGGLLIGGPFCDYIQHTPNDAVEDNSDADTDESGTPSEVPTTWPPDVGFTVIDDYDDIAFSDNVYEQTPAVTDMISQQVYRFYVGDAANISQIVISWEGYATTGGTLQVYDQTAAAWDAVMQQAITGSDATHTITIDSSTSVTVTEAASNEYVYVQVFTGTNEDLYSDYVSVGVTFTSINWTTWSGYTGPEIVDREFIVPARCIGVHSDDQTAFEAASEIGVGDWWIFILPIKNASDQEIIAKLCFEVPESLNVYVVGPDEVGDHDPRIHNVVRIGVNCWKFTVDADAEKLDDDDYLYIMVNAHSDAGPGWWTITGQLEQIVY